MRTNQVRRWSLSLVLYALTAGFALVVLFGILNSPAVPVEAACRGANCDQAGAARSAAISAHSSSVASAKAALKDAAAAGARQAGFNPSTTKTVYALVADLALHNACDNGCKQALEGLVVDLALHHDCASDRDDCRKVTAAVIAGLARNTDCADECRKKVDDAIVAIVLKSACAPSADSDNDPSARCQSGSSSSSSSSGQSSSSAANPGFAQILPGAASLCPRVTDVFANGKWQIEEVGAAGAFIKPLTDATSNNLDSVLSPDCSLIAFLSDRDSAWQIYVMKADGTEQTRLTPTTTGPLLQAAPPLSGSVEPASVSSQPPFFNMGWSADGQTVVYQYSEGGATRTGRVSVVLNNP